MTVGKKLVFGRKVIDLLMEAGIADVNTQRVVIDIPVDGFPQVHVLKLADEEFARSFVSLLRDGFIQAVD